MRWLTKVACGAAGIVALGCGGSHGDKSRASHDAGSSRLLDAAPPTVASAPPSSAVARSLSTLLDRHRLRVFTPPASTATDSEVLRDAGISASSPPPAIPLSEVTGFDWAGADPHGNGAGLRARLPPNKKVFLSVTLPARASGAFTIEDARDHKMTLTAALEGARDVDAVASQGLVFYPAASAQGASVIHRVDEFGTEDFLSFDSKPANEEIRYRVDTSQVTGLRLVENVLEFLDAEARPRIRINRPAVIDANGDRHDGFLRVVGCAVDTSPLPPTHRAFTKLDSTSCEIVITWGDAASAPIAYPALLDPTWTSGATMNTPRADHTATPFFITDEMILVTGGYSIPAGKSGPALQTAEMLDESGGGWVYTTSSMQNPRAYHRASPVNVNANGYGDVLVTGGMIQVGTAASIEPTAERWSPSTGTWTLTGPMASGGHAFHGQSLLASGTVLVAGGYANTTSNGPVTPVTEIYSPSTNTWQTVPPMPNGGAANGSFATLQDGRVLYAGGTSGAYTSFNPIPACEIYDPKANAWTSVPSLAAPLARARATVLPNGNVLVAGGISTSLSTSYQGSQVFNVATGSWSPVVNMVTPRSLHTQALLRSGLVLAAGGEPANSAPGMQQAELFDFNAGTWTATAPMLYPLTHQASVADNVGDVWVIGGIESTLPVPVVERYAPAGAIGGTCQINADCSSGFCVDGVCCNTACLGTCQACSAATKGQGADGTCGNVIAGTPDKINCPSQAPSTCGDDGTCDGNGACRLYAAGTPCRPSAGDCDVAESCPGAGKACPPDVVLSANTACPSGADTNVCTLDICDGTDVACQHPPASSATLCRASAGVCDIDDYCTGTSTTCPADAKQPSTYVCRTSAGECDPAETCTGTTNTCPADGKLPNNTACPSGADTNPCTSDICDGTDNTCQHPAGNGGVVCRAAAGECDLAETCTGTSTACPSDSKVTANTACPSGADTNPCTSDICDGTDVTCQHPAGNAGTVCRAAVDVCDLADTCTGTSTSCPADAKEPKTYVCRPAASGGCDVAEDCDGSSNSCPADGFEPSTYQCRAPSCASSVATLAANCTGSSAACPTAQTQNCSPSTCSGTVCGGCTTDSQCASNQYCSSGVCISKKSNGTSCNGANECNSAECADGVCCDTACNAGTCDSCVQPNLVGTCSPVAASTVCRAAVDACDAVETCGGNLTCPADAKLPSGTPCTDDGNACTTDLCNGTSTACQHAPGNAGTICRPADGSACDVADACDGVTTACNDAKRPNTYVCRPAAGECDIADDCDGTHDACPADQVVTKGTACSDDGNICTTDACDGTNPTCQHPPGNAGTVCQPSNGPCDVADTCNGTSTACVDQKEPKTFVCRAAAGECDKADTCDGVGNACPVDAKLPSGTACTDDGNPCTTDTCSGSGDLCQHATGNSGAVCRTAAGACDAAETCTGTSPVCPDDAKAPNTKVCRPSVGPCDVADTCDGVSNTCPPDTFEPATYACTPGSCTSGVATLPTDCTGSSASCPTPVTQVCPTGCAGTLCANPCTDDSSCNPPEAGTTPTEYCSQAGLCTPKVGAGSACDRDSACLTGHCADGVCCDTACNAGPCDSCVESGKIGTCSPVASGTVCRPSTGECDVAETCSGQLTCPADTTLDGQPCSTDGEPCTTDVCSGKVCSHVPAPPNTVCRPAGSECDVAETCGGAATCPPDARQPDGTSCTDDGVLCTTDVCQAGTCQHPAGNAGVACRPAVGECDVAEACDGVSPACPTDIHIVDGTACSGDNDVCTTDSCQAGVCAHLAGNAGTVCRVSAGECDVIEKCDGTNTQCPPDGFKTDGTACTADANPCTGDICRSGACSHPAGNPGTVCRVAASVCDVSETCDGKSTDCPPDGFQPDGTGCTEDGKLCTIDSCAAGVCTHVSADGASCNDGNKCTSPDACSAGQCSGAPVTGCTCASDSDCDDGNVCNGAEKCVAGACKAGTALDCDDGQSCTTDGCDPANGCTNVALTDGAPCDDGNYCTVNDVCFHGGCVSGTNRVCSDDSAGPCQNAVCNASSSSCTLQSKPNGTTCDDGNACTTNDKCAAATCTGTSASGCRPCTTASDCNDGNGCTTDICDDVSNRCQYVAIAGCTDGGISDGGETPDAIAPGAGGTTGNGGRGGASGNSGGNAGGPSADSGVGGNVQGAGGGALGGAGGKVAMDGGNAGATSGPGAKGHSNMKSPYGCSCEVVSRRSTPPIGPALAAAVLGGLVFRRRRARARRRARKLASFFGALLALLAVGGRAAHAQEAAEDRAAAQALYDEAKQLTAKGDYASACPKFEASQRLDAGLGTQFYLADCWQHIGRTASAWALYLDVAMGSKAEGRLDRATVADARAQALQANLSKLSISVASPAPGLKVTRDGEAVQSAVFGSPLPIDPGDHTIGATAPGKKPWQTKITIPADGSSKVVQVPALEDAPAMPVAPPTAPGPAVVAPAGTPGADQGTTTSPATLSHAGQFGAVLRADIDGKLRGAVTAVGASYGALPFLDVSLVALLGGSQGVEPAVTVLPLKGAIKPRITFAAPIFFIQGARPGFRGAAGVEWDASRQFGAFAELGGAVFPGLPAGYDKAVFLPTIGVSARL